MERRKLASDAQCTQAEEAFSRGNGREICLPVNKTGRGCDRETHRLPVPDSQKPTRWTGPVRDSNSKITSRGKPADAEPTIGERRAVRRCH